LLQLTEAAQTTNQSKIAQPVSLLVFAWLALLEVLTFGKGISGAWFYLDDWTMLHSLHFAPKSFFEAIGFYLLHDPRVTLRPLEALHFASLYALFGEKALGYHIAYAVFDVAAIWIFYLLLRDLFGKPSLAFLAATIALIDPRHDSTHYWVMCNSVSFSLFLSMLSLWLSLAACRNKQPKLHWLSLFCFTLMVFNYELFLPFLLLNAAIISAESDRATRAKSFLTWTAIFATPVVAALAYQKFLVPLFVTPFVHGIVLDPIEMFCTIKDGLALQILPGIIPLLNKHIRLNYSDYTKLSSLWIAAIGAVCAAIFIYLNGRKETQQQQAVKSASLSMMLWGLLTIVIGYSIFGLNKEYHPAIETIFNRVNTGPSLGGTMFFAGACGYMIEKLKGSPLKVVAAPLTALLAMSITCSYITLSQIFQKPWLTARLVQQNIQNILAERAADFKDNDSILLANCPRYVNWTPVFDGVWDFERMLQITTQHNNIHGGVVCERLHVSSAQIQDISSGFLCGTYKFPQIYVLLPDKRQIMPTTSAAQFIELVEKEGRQFGLSQKAIDLWKAEAAK
jgi:Dolichyl-phosphate-mannose-protein mannosyltransferase